jgi:hypothetical protein
MAVTGRGDKERLLPATTELMEELTRYRSLVQASPCKTPASKVSTGASVTNV